MLRQASADSTTSTTTTAALMRHDRTVNAPRGVSCAASGTFTPRSVRAVPGERDVLARLSGPAPIEAEDIRAIDERRAPCRDAGGRTDLGARRVRELHATPRLRSRPGQRFGLRLHLAGNGGAPGREVARHFELD